MSEDKRGTVFVRNVDGSYPCLWGHALNTCQGFYTNAPAAHPASRGGAIPFQRFLAVPIMLDQEPVGVILLANARRNYTGRDIETVERLSDVIAQAVKRERIEDERERKMRDLSSFAHTVAHDLKNPLAVMLSALDMIKDELPGDYPRLNQYLDIGVQSAERMNAIVDELLLFASVRDQDMPMTRPPAGLRTNSLQQSSRLARTTDPGQRRLRLAAADGADDADRTVPPRRGSEPAWHPFQLRWPAKRQTLPDTSG